MEPEIRTYPVELREMDAVGGKPYRYLTGRAVPYDTWQDTGEFMENHAAGSFERSTNGGTGRGLPLMVGHDHMNMDNLIGHAERWEHDGSGMYGVWRLNDQPRAQQAAQLAAAGDLTGLSVGFQEVTAHKERRNGRVWVRRTQSRLMEVSLTTIPAFPEAGVINVRSLLDPALVGAEPVVTPELDRWRARAAELHR